MTLHLLGLAHTETTSEFEFCAYTAKTRKLATMLTRAGYPVILYAGEANAAEVAEHVTVVTKDEQRAWWPEFTSPKGIRPVFNDFNEAGPGWQTFNQRAAEAIRERAKPGDIIGLTMGWTQKPVWDMLGRDDLVPVEVGIGYEGVWAPYRVFESWAWRNYMQARVGSDDMRYFDTVIPNFFEPEAFPAGNGKGGYYLFMGRLIGRKGPQIAAEAVRALGGKLVVAGQGAVSWSRSLILCEDGTKIEGDVEYVGVVGPRDRALLMGGAIASFTPTIYLEPFGGVSVEAQMAGTPAIVSAWGGLVENVVHGTTGFACSTLAQFVSAAERAPSLNRSAIRAHARSTWSTYILAGRYIDYFAQIDTLLGKGWYQL